MCQFAVGVCFFGRIAASLRQKDLVCHSGIRLRWMIRNESLARSLPLSAVRKPNLRGRKYSKCGSIEEKKNRAVPCARYPRNAQESGGNAAEHAVAEVLPRRPKPPNTTQNAADPGGM